MAVHAVRHAQNPSMAELFIYRWKTIPGWLTSHLGIVRNGNLNTTQEHLLSAATSVKRMISYWKAADTAPPEIGTAAYTASWCVNILMPGTCLTSPLYKSFLDYPPKNAIPLYSTDQTFGLFSVLFFTFFSLKSLFSVSESIYLSKFILIYRNQLL